MNKNTDSRRRFLGATAAGAIGFSTRSLVQADSVASGQGEAALPVPGELTVLSGQSIPLRSTADLSLRFTPHIELSAGAKLWLFYDIRQSAKAGQVEDPSEADFLSITAAGQKISSASIQTPPVPRTLDLFPTAPEFLHMIELTLDDRVAVGQDVDFTVRRWTGAADRVLSVLAGCRLPRAMGLCPYRFSTVSQVRTAGWPAESAHRTVVESDGVDGDPGQRRVCTGTGDQSPSDSGYLLGRVTRHGLQPATAGRLLQLR